MYAMVPPSFSCAAGDIVAAIRLLQTIVRAFRNTAGSSSAYQHPITYLKSLETIIRRLEEYAAEHPEDSYIRDIYNHLDTITTPWKKFQSSLNLFEGSLSVDSSR
jgi:hypothetical protein